MPQGCPDHRGNCGNLLFAARAWNMAFSYWRESVFKPSKVQHREGVRLVWLDKTPVHQGNIFPRQQNKTHNPFDHPWDEDMTWNDSETVSFARQAFYRLFLSNVCTWSCNVWFFIATLWGWPSRLINIPAIARSPYIQRMICQHGHLIRLT